jgi:hypothetical protein
VQKVLDTQVHFGRINPHAKVSQIRCPRDFTSCIGRGIERKEIFYNDADRSDFIDRQVALVDEGAVVR